MRGWILAWVRRILLVVAAFVRSWMLSPPALPTATTKQLGPPGPREDSVE
jgi:hypothetical protein